jgi:hypothetical protein
MKELIGFFLLGIFVLIIYRLLAMEQHLSWRAFPFVLSAFMGLSFQSENFFDDFQNISRAFLKTSFFERDLTPEQHIIPPATIEMLANPAPQDPQQ